MFEVQLVNMMVLFILILWLCVFFVVLYVCCIYIVNVFVMEGVFGCGYKGFGYLYINMVKVVVNMFICISVCEMFEIDGIFMISVDIGWIMDECLYLIKVWLVEEGFYVLLDFVDGVVCVYDLVVCGEVGEDVFGVFLKDYKLLNW